MKPYSSNLQKESCSPISSNCVIWQGPDLLCIGLCKGDTISEVTYKLALELCTLKDNFDFTDVDLACILTVCTTSPEPEKTLGNILNLIINKVCCLSDIVKNIDPGSTEEPYINLAQCFLPYTDAQGNSYTKLPHSQYTYEIGVKLCTLYSQVQVHESDINTIKGQIQTILNTPPPTIPQVTPNCLAGPGVVPGIPTDVDVVLNELEKQWCELTEALGSASDLTTASAQACLVDGGPLANATPLSTGTGSMATAFPTWISPVTNFAESMNNLWLTVCDIRAAVKSIQDTCCKVSCADIIIAFDAVVTTDGNGDTVLRLFFGQTVMPLTWYDCNQTAQVNTTVYPYGWTGNKLTIKDSLGHVRDVYIQLRNEDLSDGILQDPTIISLGYDIMLSGTNIDADTPITVSGDICVTDGSTSCVKCVSVDATFDSTGCCTITNNSNVANTIIYSICSTTTTTTLAP